MTHTKLKSKFTKPINEKFEKVDFRGYSKALESQNAELLEALKEVTRICRNTIDRDKTVIFGNPQMLSDDFDSTMVLLDSLSTKAIKKAEK